MKPDRFHVTFLIIAAGWLAIGALAVQQWTAQLATNMELRDEMEKLRTMCK